jgi:colicin import membrane protein
MSSLSTLPPRAPQGLSKSFSYALLMHALLVGALALGTRWKSSEPAAVEAELWGAVQIAAPRAEPPPPQPEVKQQPTVEPKPEPKPQAKAPEEVKPDIALEKKKEEEKRKREAEELEKEAKAKAEKERREAEKLKKELEDERNRKLATLTGSGAPNSPGVAEQSRGHSSGYPGRIAARVRPNIVFNYNEIDGNPAAEVEVRLAPDGMILSRRIIKSSGVKAWDDAVLRALDRTEVLPKDVDGRVPKVIELIFRPKD